MASLTKELISKCYFHSITDIKILKLMLNSVIRKNVNMFGTTCAGKTTFSAINLGSLNMD